MHNCIIIMIITNLTRIYRWIEYYCNQVGFLSFCVCVFPKYPITTLEFQLSCQETWTYAKIKDRIFLKSFGYKVMTIFTTHDCHFTTFRRLLVTKEYSSCLMVIAVESQLESKYSWSSGCCNIKLALSLLPWCSISSSTYFMHIIEDIKLFYKAQFFVFCFIVV